MEKFDNEELAREYLAVVLHGKTLKAYVARCATAGVQADKIRRCAVDIYSYYQANGCLKAIDLHVSVKGILERILSEGSISMIQQMDQMVSHRRFRHCLTNKVLEQEGHWPLHNS